MEVVDVGVDMSISLSFAAAYAQALGFSGGWATLCIWLYTQPFAWQISFITLVRLRCHPSETRDVPNGQSHKFEEACLLKILVIRFDICNHKYPND